MKLPIVFVLWHYPHPGVDPEIYEGRLGAFHASLKASRPDGFVISESARFVRLPWLAADSATYQDWYVVSDFAAMGILNDAAVAGVRRGPHDEVAAHAAEGVGGVYAIETGDPCGTANPVFHWLRKPQGHDTIEYLRTLGEITERAGATLWRRQMNLGAAPEYCLRSKVELEVPGLKHVLREDRSIWSG